MSDGPLPLDAYTLADLLDYWQRGELTLDEVIKRWPPADATREDVARELLRMILGLHARVAAIDDFAIRRGNSSQS